VTNGVGRSVRVKGMHFMATREADHGGACYGEQRRSPRAWEDLQ
jgi:hypothetical protein